MAELKYIEGYPEYIYKLIDIVHRTRQKRKEHEPPPMTKEEQEETLKLHPDYVAGGKRKISIGPNKGEVGPVLQAPLPASGQICKEFQKIEYYLLIN